MNVSKPSIGRVVHYTLSKHDATLINKRRQDAYDSKIAAQNSGAVVHVGNSVAEGDVYPMMIVRVWSPDMVNGQVILDGDDTLWVTSVKLGVGPCSYAWPVRD